MKFNLAPSTDGYAVRYISEGDRWECGIHQNDLDSRYFIAAGLVNSQCYEANYCCGKIASTPLYALAILMKVLEVMPPNITPDILKKFLPDRQSETWLLELEDAMKTFDQAMRLARETVAQEVTHE